MWQIMSNNGIYVLIKESGHKYVLHDVIFANFDLNKVEERISLEEAKHDKAMEYLNCFVEKQNLYSRLMSWFIATKGNRTKDYKHFSKMFIKSNEADFLYYTGVSFNDHREITRFVIKFVPTE